MNVGNSFFPDWFGNLFWFVTLSSPLFKQIEILPFLFCTRYLYFSTKDFIFCSSFSYRRVYTYHQYIIIQLYTLQQSTKRDVDLYENKCGTIRSKTGGKYTERAKKKFLIKSFLRLCINKNGIVLNKHKCEFKMCDNKWIILFFSFSASYLGGWWI